MRTARLLPVSACVEKITNSMQKKKTTEEVIEAPWLVTTQPQNHAS